MTSIYFWQPDRFRYLISSLATQKQEDIASYMEVMRGIGKYDRNEESRDKTGVKKAVSSSPRIFELVATI